MMPTRGMRPPTVGGGMPFQSGVNSTSQLKAAGEHSYDGMPQVASPSPKSVGWQNKGNRNPSGFGGPMTNPDSGGGTSINMRAPRAAGGVIGPPPGGSQMRMAGGFNSLM